MAVSLPSRIATDLGFLSNGLHRDHARTERRTICFASQYFKETQNWGLFSALNLIRFYFVRATIIVRLPRPEMNNSNYESGSPGPQ